MNPNQPTTLPLNRQQRRIQTKRINHNVFTKKYATPEKRRNAIREYILANYGEDRAKAFGLQEKKMKKLREGK